MTTAFELKVNGIDKTPPSADEDSAAEWDVTWEERIDGVGTASGTIQDRNNDGPDFAKDRDEIEMLVSGDRVFHGEITRAKLLLPAGRPFRRWRFSATDYNTILDLRLVGTPDGSDFTSIDGGQTHSPIDPHAHCRATDRLTVAWLFEKYAAMPNGDPIDATTFVRHYVNKFILYNKHGKPVLWWTHATLRAALDELANMAGFPIFYWLDPDDKFHWVNFKDFAAGLGALPRLFPRSSTMDDAPAFITDSGPNGTTSVGGRDFEVEWDATFMPEQVYVVGATDHLSTDGVHTTYQGTGFEGRQVRDISKRQILVDTQALTEAQKDATARSYRQYNKRARLKGAITVGTPTEAIDGWHCGQKLKIVDARWSLSGSSFPIHRVAGSLKAGNDFRVYRLEFGDAPIGRFGKHYKAAPQRIPRKRIPATEHKITFPTTHLRPSTEYVLYSQMVDTSGASFRQGGVAVTLSMVVTDRAGSVISTGTLDAFDEVITAAGFTVPKTNTTDPHGRTGARLTTGSFTGMHYQVRAVSPIQRAEPDVPST